MMSMNRQMKLPQIQKIMQEFEKQSEIMDMKEEMMNDVIGNFTGVYNVFCNFIFFPTPIFFLILILFPQSFHPIPLFPTWYSSQQP